MGWFFWLGIGFIIGAFVSHTITIRGCEKHNDTLSNEVMEQAQQRLVAEANVAELLRKNDELRDENVRLLNDQFKEELET